MEKTTTDYYVYEENGVKLDFTFARGKNEVQQKKAFIKMLRQAANDLEKEIGV